MRTHKPEESNMDRDIATIEAKKQYLAFIADLPEVTRSQIDGQAIANSFAAEVYDEYDDNLERWQVALATARMYADGGLS